jgi:phytoene dehydrogenase-like protein
LKALGMGATNYWAFDNYDFDALYGEVDGDALPPVRGCYITSATLKDPQSPGHAPPGVETVEIMALMPGRPEVWGVPQAAAWGPGYRREAVYQERKQKVEADLIGRLEKLFPTSTKEILHQESATPVSHSRFTWASGGSGYGLAATPEHFLERRPGYRGPIDGMFLCGASTRAGHGVVGALASGAHAAKAILKDT